MSRGRRHTLALSAAQNVRSGMTPDAALSAALDGKSLAATDRTLVEQELAELLERDPQPAATPGPTAEEVRAEVISEVDAVDADVRDGEWDNGAGFVVAPIVVPDDDGSVEGMTEGEAVIDALRMRHAVDPSWRPRPDDARSVDASMVSRGAGGILEVVVPFDPSFADDPVIAPPGAAERDAEVERIASGTAGGKAKHERRSTTERLDAALVDLDAARTEVRRLRFLQLADALATFVASKPAATVLRSAVHAGFWSEAESVARRGCEIAGITTPAWVDAADGGQVIDVSLAVWCHDDASDTCEVTIDGRRVASVQFAAVDGEMQIVPYALNGAASAKAARSLLLKIAAE